MLRLAEVETLTGLKKSTIYKLMREKAFPNGVQITARHIAWPESRIHGWIQERIARADKAQA
jgi:prophage regulatory protein